MGKYMKKGKITGDVAVMEILQNSTSLGVRTRARTLALQPNPELSYLQLRSRRLEKPPFPPSSNPKTPNHNHNNNHSSENPKNNNNNSNSDSQKPTGSRVRVSNSGSAAGSKKSQGQGQGQGRFGNFADVGESEDFHDLSAVEPSFGENNLDFDSRERSTRESTPCSLIRDSENITTPGSTSRPTCSAAANRRARNPQRAIPTNPEMEEFFARFELDQQKLFIEKYNYDIMNDMPLPGRYEWVRVDH